MLLLFNRKLFKNQPNTLLGLYLVEYQVNYYFATTSIQIADMSHNYITVISETSDTRHMPYLRVYHDNNYCNDYKQPI